MTARSTDHDTSTSGRLLLAAAVFGLGFQAVHVIEHLLQVGYWVLHPTLAPWLTPWAAAGRDVLARASDGTPGGGNELLHLAGNVIFLAGVVALAAWMSRQSRPRPRALRAAGWVQSAHVAEHVLLTATWFVTGRAIGATTLFGAVHGVAASSLRVWAHLALNLLATSYAVRGVHVLAFRTTRGGAAGLTRESVGLGGH